MILLILKVIKILLLLTVFGLCIYGHTINDNISVPFWETDKISEKTQNLLKKLTTYRFIIQFFSLLMVMMQTIVYTIIKNGSSAQLFLSFRNIPFKALFVVLIPFIIFIIGPFIMLICMVVLSILLIYSSLKLKDNLVTQYEKEKLPEFNKLIKLHIIIGILCLLSVVIILGIPIVLRFTKSNNNKNTKINNDPMMSVLL